jgi:DNA-binding beta-propeller fold protein YncE
LSAATKEDDQVTTPLRFELVPGWEQLPPEYSHRDVCGVAVDGNDRVYLLTRHVTRVLVYERDGRFVTAWGGEIFTDRTHGLRFAPDGHLYTVDDGDHTVRKFTPQGRLLMTLGTPGKASDTGYDESCWGRDTYKGTASIRRGGPPFNKPTGVAIAPSGDLYVCDGYANARVHRFSPEGALLQSWGEPGTGPGQFNLPHGIWVAPDGRVLVADRENERVQLFSPDGRFLSQWTDVQRPTDVYMDREGFVYVSELGWRKGDRSFARGDMEEAKPGRMSIFDLDGRLQARWGGPDGCAPGSFCAPHAACVDSRGDLYVAEVIYSFAGRRGLVPPDCHTFQKFTRR